MFQFVSIASYSGSGHYWKKPGSFLCLCTLPSCFWAWMRSPWAFSRQIPALSASRTGEVLLSLDHLGGQMLDSLQHLPWMRRSRSRPSIPNVASPSAEGKDHFSWPAGNALPNVVQDTIRFLISKGLLLAHVQLGAHQDTYILFCRAISSWLSPSCPMWDCSSSGAGFCACSYWTSWGSYSPICQSLSGPVSCHLWIYWGCQ